MNSEQNSGQNSEQSAEQGSELAEQDQDAVGYSDTNGDEPSIWKRALFMLLCALFYSVAEVVLFAVVVAQFFFKLISGHRNQRLLRFGQSIATYVYQIIQYLNFNSEYMPFPFHDWPKGAPLDSDEEPVSDTAGNERS